MFEVLWRGVGVDHVTRFLITTINSFLFQKFVLYILYLITAKAICLNLVLNCQDSMNDGTM